MNIIHRHYIAPVLTFLGGILVGFIATSGQGESPEPADAAERLAVANAPDGATADRAVGLPAHKAPPAAALSAKPEEPLPTARNAFQRESDLETRLHAMSTAWTRLQSDVAALQGRVDDLARKLSASAESSVAASVASTGRSPPSKPKDRRSALVTAGVEENRAADLVWRQGQQELERLELRDIAIREGWFGTDRYREELGQIDEEALDLREEIGEDSYDRFLFAADEDNRVAVASIIPGSLAEDAGLQPGDLVESYGGSRVFRFEDLRTATTKGERGELVLVRIRRGDGVLDTWLPRGPLGVHLDRASVDPDA